MLIKLMTAAVVALAAAFSQAGPVAAPQSDLAIVGVTVLPMEGPERQADQTVLVQGDRITAVGPRSRVRVPAGAQIIDGRGKVLMPGLVDMHVHLAPVPGEPGDAAQRALAGMLAHGTTPARTMAGSLANLAVRTKIEAGELAGPRLYVAAPALHEKNTVDVGQARQAVAEARSAGYDLIKSHHLTDPAVWQAVQDAAREAGLPVAGHVSNTVGLDRALAAGQQVEHLDGIIAALVPAGAPEKAIEFGQIPPPPVVRAAAGVSDKDLAALGRKVAGAKSWHVPTLALFEKIVAVDVPAAQLLPAEHRRFVPDEALRQWAQQRRQLEEMGMTVEDGRALRDLRRRIVGAFHRAGVPMMAGSDTAQAFHIWGPGLHQEIEALAAAGLSPMDALRAATVVPRDYFRSLANGGSALGWDADFGTVTKGARADLILLAGDPGKDLAQLRKPAAVIAGGRLYGRAALDSMLARVAADANPPLEDAAALPKQIYVVRHLQKAAGDDPPLTDEGAALAAQLAEQLADAGITAIFATPTRRAMQTAEPLARRLGTAVSPYDPRDPAALVQAAAAAPGNVLVVGHSNTVDDLVRRFGGTPPPPLTEEDYGTVWHIDGPRNQTRTILLGPAR